MRPIAICGLAGLLVLLGGGPEVAAQQRSAPVCDERVTPAAGAGASGARPPVLGQPAPGREAEAGANTAGKADVVLSVPRLRVERLQLSADSLDARLSLNASVASLVNIRAGADVQLSKVEIELCGVATEAYLDIRLDNVTTVLLKALQTIDAHPAVLDNARSATAGPPRSPPPSAPPSAP